jgi:hypothetical protein
MWAQTAVDRKAEVWGRLQTVTDPELDEPVTELEFVTRADVDADNCVHIDLIDLEVDDAGARLRKRYLERRPIVADATSRAFAGVEGDPLQAETLSTYVRTLRRVDINAEFNSALCRGLLHARFDMETPLSTKTGQRVEQP